MDPSLYSSISFALLSFYKCLKRRSLNCLCYFFGICDYIRIVAYVLKNFAIGCSAMDDDYVLSILIYFLVLFATVSYMLWFLYNIVVLCLR